MKRTLINQLALLGVVSAIMSEHDEFYNTSFEDEKPVTTQRKPQPIPKGCKEYFFNRQGKFSTERMLRSECVFICVASNDKTAIKKFNKKFTNSAKHD